MNSVYNLDDYILNKSKEELAKEIKNNVRMYYGIIVDFVKLEPSKEKYWINKDINTIAVIIKNDKIEINKLKKVFRRNISKFYEITKSALEPYFNEAWEYQCNLVKNI